MSAQRFSGVELSSIAKRDTDRTEFEIRQELKRARAAKHETPNESVWSYRTPGAKRRGRGK